MFFNSNKKVTFIFFIFLFSAVGLVSRSVFLQVISRDKLREYSKSQTIREIKSYPNRANILDRKLNPLAINISTYSIFAMPKAIENKDVLIKLAKILNEENQKKYSEKVKGRSRFTWLERQIELVKNQVDRVKELKGIYLEKSVKRYYPNQNLSSQVLGSVGVDNKGQVGS